MRNHIGRLRVDFNISGSDYTFILTRTTLDYILCSNSLCSYENIYHVYEEGLFSSTSDHLPVLMSIDIQPKNRTSNKSLNCLPAWHKADSCKIDSYQKHVSEKAISLLDRNVDCAIHIDTLRSDLTHLLQDASSNTIPVSRYKPCLKPEWIPEVKQLQDMERQKRRIVISRISEGRSRGMCHESYKNFKRDKRFLQRASNCT